MLYINKRRTPRDIKDAVEKVVKTPDSGYRELELPLVISAIHSKNHPYNFDRF